MRAVSNRKLTAEGFHRRMQAREGDPDSRHSPARPSIPASGKSLGWIGPTARTVPGDKLIYQEPGRKAGYACVLNRGRHSVSG